MLKSEFVTDVPLIDYIRIATYDLIQYYNLTATLERKYTAWQPKKWLQYKGRQSQEKVFHGIGDQNGRAHAIIQVSGYNAHLFWTWLKRLPAEAYSSFYCTRIDLQMTKERPEFEYRPTAYKRLTGAKSIIQSDTGITLYIGARTSDTFWRLYDKTEWLLRVEVEIKNKLARRTFASLKNEEPLTNIWNRFILRSRVPKAYTDLYRADGDIAELPELEETEDLEGKLHWLMTLDGLVYKLAKDHDTSEALRTVIKRWAEYCAES